MAIVCARPLWRCPRFSLRTLLIVFAVSTIPLALKANQLVRRQKAVELLEQWDHGPIAADYSFYDQLPWRLLPARFNSWFAPCVIPYAAIRRPSGCVIPPMPVGPFEDEWIALTPTEPERRRLVAAIAALPELRHLRTKFEVDEHDLVELECLTSLKTLRIRARALPNAFVAGLLRLRTVSTINLQCTFSDRLPVEPITKLRSHPSLEILEIWGDFRHDDGDTERIKEALPEIQVEIR